MKQLRKFINHLRESWTAFWLIKNQTDQISRSRIYAERSHFFNGVKNVYFLNIRQGNEAIYDLLVSEKPVMIARHGGTEIKVSANFDTENEITFLDELCFNSGFFPCDKKLAEDWVDLYLNASRNLDLICEWNYRYGRFNEVQHVFAKYSPHAVVANDIKTLTPFFHAKPWTRVLKGLRVLVIHPFANTIRSQYEKRGSLFKNPDVLPDFESLETMVAVQTMVGNKDSRFSNWFDAYDHMCAEISKREFDVALIGCGCYGLVLASYVKSLGKNAVHMGGCLQLLFGIRGRRWDNAQDWIEQGLFNEHWVRPSEDETPERATGMEGGAYW